MLTGISLGDEVHYSGSAYSADAARKNNSGDGADRGFPTSPLYHHSFGIVETADADAIVVAATSTELPNNATKTYTTATDGTSPLDGAIAAPSNIVGADGTTYLCWALDVPRNVTADATHGSSVVAMTIVVYGLDEYFKPMREQLSIAATGTTQSATGKKAFKYIYQITIASAGNATTNTLNMGFGTSLGLPYRFTRYMTVTMRSHSATTLIGTAYNMAFADDTTATATTGDIRGTIIPVNAPNSSYNYTAAFIGLDGSSTTNLYGIAQYNG